MDGRLPRTRHGDETVRGIVRRNTISYIYVNLAAWLTATIGPDPERSLRKRDMIENGIDRNRVGWPDENISCAVCVNLAVAHADGCRHSARCSTIRRYLQSVRASTGDRLNQTAVLKQQRCPRSKQKTICITIQAV